MGVHDRVAVARHGDLGQQRRGDGRRHGQYDSVTRGQFDLAAGKVERGDVCAVARNVPQAAVVANSSAVTGQHGQRWIDANIVVTASEGPVKFGDTKEGCFGVRVAGSMRTELGKGGKILTSEGKTDKDAWGKAAAWVDYFGPVDGETVGVAILNHPSSFRFPTYWHVRTYGLFTANPFGVHDFKGSDEFDGSYTIQKGESLTLRHRVLFHVGDSKTGKVAEAFQQYAN